MVYITLTITTVSLIDFYRNRARKTKMSPVQKSLSNRAIPAKQIISSFKITYQTLNHYTDLGLLPVLLKKGNVRFYDREVVAKRLSEIRRLSNEGYSLRLIRKRMIGI